MSKTDLMYLSKVIDISSYTRTYIFVFTKGTLYELQIKKFQLILTHSNLTFIDGKIHPGISFNVLNVEEQSVLHSIQV